MFAISEFPGDSNGDDRNKKSEEDESKKKGQEDESKKKGKEIDNGIPFRIPDGAAIILLARLGRLHYPSASIVCRDLGRLTKLEELYAKRSELGNIETVLYVLIEFPSAERPRWYILNRNSRLGKVSSLPTMPLRPAVVAIGFEIYVFGGSIGEEISTSQVIVIDCRFNTTRALPNMRRARYIPVAEVMDGKIYVIGGCEMTEPNWVEVFDIETETWSDVPGPYTEESNVAWLVDSVVLQDKKKILIWNPPDVMSYEPGANKWEKIWGNLRDWWEGSSCLVRDMLFTIHTSCTLGNPIIWFDMKQELWKPVRGVDFGEGPLDMPSDLFNNQSRMTSFDGELVILGGNHCPYRSKKTIWRIVIALTKEVVTVGDRDEDQVSGNVVKVECVFTSSPMVSSPYIEHCLTVRV